VHQHGLSGDRYGPAFGAIEDDLPRIGSPDLALTDFSPLAFEQPT